MNDITHQMQFALCPVVKREGEHSNCVAKRLMKSSLRECLEQSLGVRMPAPASVRRMPRGLKVRANFLVIVDLAIVADDPLSVGAEHRLMAGRREIDHGQTRVAERHAGGGIEPDASIVRPAVPELIDHGLERFSGAIVEASG